MSLKASCCPRCLTLNHERGMVHTCTPTSLVRELEQRIIELEKASESSDQWIAALESQLELEKGS